MTVPVTGEPSGSAGRPDPVGSSTGSADAPLKLTKAARWVLRIGRLAIVGQFVWLAAFSTVEYQRGSLTWDYSLFDQARWLLVHGIWDPIDTISGIPYWQNHGELLMWPLAQITRLPPGGLWLLWLQALAAAGCGWVCLSWVADLCMERAAQAGADIAGRLRQLSPYLIALVLVLVTANIGVYYTTAFDFHFETIGAFFALLSAREIYGRGRKRVWWWVALTCATGDVSSLYVVGVGISGLLGAGRQRRRLSAEVALAGLLWLAVLTVVHANRGEGLVGMFGYLAGGVAVAHAPTLGQIAKGALTHPGRVLSQLWADRWDIWADLAPAGIVGFFSPLAFGVALLVLLSSVLPQYGFFAEPGFQVFPMYGFVAVGTASVLFRLGEGRWTFSGRRLPPSASRWACVGLGALALAWAVVWLPHYPSRWLVVTPSGGRAVQAARALIPERAEVVVSQGIGGRFVERSQVFEVESVPDRVPIRERQVYFVLSATQGIEVPVQDTEAVLAQVADDLGATPVEHQAGVWVFRWDPPAGTRSVTLQGPQDLVDAWTLPSSAGSAVLAGPASQWRVAGNGSEGYVVHGDYWYQERGSYQASVQLSSTGPVSVEVWNANTNTLLARRQLDGTNGEETVTIPYQQGVAGSVKPFSGWGPFTSQQVPPPPGQPVEVRVYDPGGSLVNVYTVGVAPAPAS